jgi:integrase
MTYAHKRRWIAANPCTIERGTSYTPSEPPIPTDKQVETILEKISEVGRALITLGSEAGLRRGEIMELRRKDISTIDDAGEKRVVVSVRRAVIWLKGGAPLVKKPKSSKSVRDIVLGLRASRIILSYLGTVNLNPESLLFSSPAGFDQHWSESTYRKYIAEGRELAGYFRLHSLRTYHLTRFRQSGATEKETMDRGGHADIKTAMRYQRSTGRDAELLRAVGD